MSLNNYRQVIIKYSNKDEIKNIIQKNNSFIKERNIKIILEPSKNTGTTLIGYDGTIKKIYSDFNVDILKDIFFRIDQMSMRVLDEKIRESFIGGNMRLYTDDIPSNTIKGTGFKNLKKAQDTIRLIKNRSIIYQLLTVRALYYRALYHKNKTDGMKKAIKFYKKWIKDNNDKKIKYKYANKKIIKKYYEQIKNKKFIDVYLKEGKSKLPFLLINKNKPTSLDYDSFREKNLDKIVNKKNKLFVNNKPTYYYLKLLSLVYNPSKKIDK